MSGATFGRKGAGPDPDLAARRAAFLAAERARAAEAPAGGARGASVEPGFGRPVLAEPRYVPRKTNRIDSIWAIESPPSSRCC
jgi:hypothetical protein